MMLTQYIKVCSPVGCDPFIETTTWKVYFTSAEARLRLHRTREEDPEVVFLRREKKKGFVYTSCILHFESRESYSLLVKINDMELVRKATHGPYLHRTRSVVDHQGGDLGVYQSYKPGSDRSSLRDDH